MEAHRLASGVTARTAGREGVGAASALRPGPRTSRGPTYRARFGGRTRKCRGLRGRWRDPGASSARAAERPACNLDCALPEYARVRCKSPSYTCGADALTVSVK